jgi:AraC family transcriptional regulator
MKYPHGIPLWRTNGELLPPNPLSRVVLSSVGTKWNDVVVEQHHFPSKELADVTHNQHVSVVTLGHPISCEFKKEGRFQRVYKARRAISFFPSGQPFSLRLNVERGVFANVLFLALDPLFLSRVAEGLELDADRIELIEQRRRTDRALHHIAMALRAGIQSGNTLDRMYGEALSTALAVHLLRQYGATVLSPKRQYGGLPRASWCVLSNIFKINWAQT